MSIKVTKLLHKTGCSISENEVELLMMALENADESSHSSSSHFFSVLVFTHVVSLGYFVSVMLWIFLIQIHASRLLAYFPDGLWFVLVNSQHLRARANGSLFITVPFWVGGKCTFIEPRIPFREKSEFTITRYICPLTKLLMHRLLFLGATFCLLFCTIF